MKQLVFSVLVLVGSVFGSVAGADPVDHREVRQETRIEQGRHDGSVTRRENRRLEAQQHRIQHEERRAEADGVVTPREDARLTRHQNRANRSIRRARHNGQTQQ